MRHHNYRPLIDRFNEKYIPEPNSGCWIWIAGVDRDGYGTIRGGTDIDIDDNVQAHRASWMLHRGKLESEALVCHHCDNRSCVNPDHLFIGTALDNARDMVRKGRSLRGETLGRSNIKESDIPIIRNSPENNHVLAARYGVGPSAIWAIKHRKKWKHVA